MAESIFFTTIDENVRKILDGRSAVYAKQIRDTDSYQWLYQKMAWAAAICTNSVTGRINTLDLPIGAGIGDQGLFETVSKKDNIYVPKPHLNSVKISSDGDWGSLKKCEISFTVYTLEQLNDYQVFFDIASELTVQYGWNKAGGLGGTTGNFKGTVYNFSYSVNANGGFDCTTYAMSEGINILGTSPSITANLNLTQNDDQTSSVINSISTYIESFTTTGELANLKSGQTTEISLPPIPPLQPKKIKIGVFSIVPNADDVTKSIGIKYTSPTSLYITLNAFFEILNTFIIKSAINANTPTFICNENITLGPIPADVSHFISADPKEIIFPNCAPYDGKTQYFTDLSNFTTNKDCSLIMISVEFILSIIDKISKETTKQQKSSDISLKSIIQPIFDSIYRNSGDRIKLSLTENPKNSTEILIVDTNYFKDNPTVYEMKVVTEGGISRNLSLTSKVPQELQTAAYVVGSSAGSAATTAAAGFARIFGNQEPISQDKINNLFVNVESSINKVNSSLNDPTKYVSATSALRSALREFYIAENNSQSAVSQVIPFPIDLSVTLDGIEGLVFGNTFTVNYLPAVYQSATGKKIAFTITKVEHDISSNDWSTTVSTVCRLVMDVSTSTSPALTRTDTKLDPNALKETAAEWSKIVSNSDYSQGLEGQKKQELDTWIKEQGEQLRKNTPPPR